MEDNIVDRTYSVTQKIAVTKQPSGGYLPIKDFTAMEFDGLELMEQSLENYRGAVVGGTVDNLFRYMTNDFDAEDAFKIAKLGIEDLDRQETFYSDLWDGSNRDELIQQYESNIKVLEKKLSKKTIIAAIKLTELDTIGRAGAWTLKPNPEEPNEVVINNVKKMVQSSLKFLKEFGPIVDSGITFHGGYSNVVNQGDGDFITKDTLWDMKVIKSRPSAKHTLQLLMYFIMAKKSKQKKYKDLKYVGIWNPRLNKVYKFKVSDLDKSIIKEIEKDVIEY